MAYNKYFNGRKQETKKKSRRKQQTRLMSMKALTNAMTSTRRKKPVKGTVLGDIKNPSAVKLVEVKKQEEVPPINYSQNQLI